MKVRFALSFLAVIGLLFAALYGAQQPGNLPSSKGTSPVNDPLQAPSLRVEEDQSGNQFLASAFTDLMKGTVFDEIQDPGERQAFGNLFKGGTPEERRKVAEDFLEHYPQSAFLAQAYENAAKASVDLGDDKAAIQFGRKALKLFPENPMLLVPVAYVQMRQGDSAEAVQNASLALDCLDRFTGPASISEKDWAVFARHLRATSLYLLAEGAAAEGLRASGGARNAKLQEAEEFSTQSWQLDSSDANNAYLLGIIRLARGNPKEAAPAFAVAYRQDGPLKAKAEQRLRAIYAPGPSQPQQGFEEFVRSLPAPPPPPESGTTAKPGHTRAGAPAYAGSSSCQRCHPGEYAGWLNTGHARMFRPYKFENVFGDFNSATFADETGKVVARMTHDATRHYFETLDTQGEWHRYRVDYTIGAKWQQTYATRLPSGDIQVFPLQYNRLQNRWVAFWRTIDSPKTERGQVVYFSRLDSDTSYLPHCAPCHTSQLRLTTVVSPKVKDMAFGEPGINCEMCHGPSGDHVASMRTAKPGYTPPLKLQVEYKKISSRDYIAICAQCHMQTANFAHDPEGDFNYRHYADTFYEHYQSRPYNEFALRAFYRDGRFRVVSFIVESFMRTQCVQKGGANCGHCHDFHPSDIGNERDLKFLDHPDQMCLQCHPSYAANLEAHTHHAASSPGSRCTACHMPKIMTTVLFKTMTHRIDDIPNAEMTERFGQQYSPNACLICHTDKDIAWLKRELSKWPGHKEGSLASTSAAGKAVGGGQ
jgi:tetratricopeptide (TPR) repeat protein